MCVQGSPLLPSWPSTGPEDSATNAISWHGEKQDEMGLYTLNSTVLCKPSYIQHGGKLEGKSGKDRGR